MLDAAPVVLVESAVEIANSQPQSKAQARSDVAVRSATSWLGLVAATTKGIGQFGRVRVRIRASVRIPGSSFRLVVHSYSAASLKHGEPPTAVIPIASVQRSVSQDELRSGIELDVVHVGASRRVPDDVVVFAWVEQGQPNFQYDAALARPSVGALKGRAVPRQRCEECRVAELHLTAA